MNSTPAALRIESLSLSRGEKQLYHGFSLTVEAGSVTSLIAPSGCGKTTLLDWIGGILPESGTQVHGTLHFRSDNEDVWQEKRPRISYLFQEPRLLPQVTVLRNVELPLYNLMTKVQSRERALAFLAQAGLAEKQNSYPTQLSGGEKQRVSLARAFAYPSPVLLMDEAFQSQDVRIKIKLMEQLASLLKTEKRTVLFVTHEVREAVCLASRIVVLDGRPLEVLLDLQNTPSPSAASYITPSEQHLAAEQQIMSLLCR